MTDTSTTTYDDDFEDEVGAEGNRIVGARARAVVEHVTRNLVDDPDAIVVDVEERRDEVTLLVHANPGDMGRLIGKRGRVIQALRQVVARRGHRRRREGHRRRRRVARDDARRRATASRSGGSGGRTGCAARSRSRFSSNRPERTAPGAVLYVGERELVVDAVAARTRTGCSCASPGSTTAPRPSGCWGVELTADPLAGDAELDDDELWVHELVGAEVRRPRRRAGSGRVVAVEANPAHDLLVLDGGALVPMVFVVEQREPAWSWSTRPTACSTSDEGRCRAHRRVHDLPRVPRRAARRVAARPGARPRACSTCACTTRASYTDRPAPQRRRRAVRRRRGHGDGARSRCSPRSRPSRPPRPLLLLSAGGRRFDQACARRAGRRRRVLAAVRPLRGRRPAGRRPPVRRRAVGRRLRARRRRGGGAAW